MHTDRSRRTRRTVAVIVALGLLGVGLVLSTYLAASRPQGASEPAGEQAGRYRIVLPRDADSLAAAVGSDPAGRAAAPVGEPDYRRQFRSARDLWQFSESIYPAAMGGDSAAQYFLFRALKYCFEFERFYFLREGGRRTLDEAMEWASTRPDTSAEEVAEIHEKCRRFQETSHPFGNKEEWLGKAQDGGFELAIFEAARKRISSANRTDLPAAGDDARKQGRLLAVEALRSKDPEVIFGIGELAHLFWSDPELATRQRWVWVLAACKRGHDCGPGAEWHRYYCHYDWNCQPSDTGADLVRRANPDTFDEIDRLSDQLNAKLDADDFDVFGSTRKTPD